MSEEMKDEYDFTGAERGKFYRQGAVFQVPVYLEEAIQSRLSAAAERQGRSLDELVNELLRKDIDILEAMK